MVYEVPAICVLIPANRRIHLPVCTCTVHGKCSKISNTFLILFFNKMLVVRAGVHKILDRIANRESPGQTCVWVVCSIFDRQVVFKIFRHTHTHCAGKVFT